MLDSLLLFYNSVLFWENSCFCHGVACNTGACPQELTYKKLPKLYKHLQAQQCEMSIIATDWFLCLFATTLPSEVCPALPLTSLG